MNLNAWLCAITIIITIKTINSSLPIVLNTWAFTNAAIKAWEVLNTQGKTALDALVEGCATCEEEQCDGTVGYGGSPDENGETCLDAFIIDGSNLNMGGVASLREIKSAIAVARHVLENTKHTLLAGEQATNFAEMMGFQRESLTTPKSKNLWKNWKSSNCQPNFWNNVVPNPKETCGPYKPKYECSKNFKQNNVFHKSEFDNYHHDTIGMIVIDKNGQIFAGTSTNGAIHKIPGRVGDASIPGAGAYADNEVGAAVATGDGDIMMRFLPSFFAVQNMRMGVTPQAAAEKAIRSIYKYYKDFKGAVVASTKSGEYSAACSGIEKFPFSVYDTRQDKVIVEYVKCIT